MAMKFVIKKVKSPDIILDNWKWSLIQDGTVILENAGFHSEKMCRNNINQVKKVTKFTKVELLEEAK